MRKRLTYLAAVLVTMWLAGFAASTLGQVEVSGAPSSARDLTSGDSPRYAVLSLIGDSITAVEWWGNIGSHLDPHRSESITLRPQLLDRVALDAVQRTIKRANSQTPVLLY